MNPSTKNVIVVFAVVLVLALLGLWLMRSNSAAPVQKEVRNMGHDLQKLEKDAEKGVKDGYDATKDAAHDATEAVKDAVK